MILLVTHGHPTMLRYRHPHLGRLIQPRRAHGKIAETAEAGIPWAADNDAFNAWGEGEIHRYRRMLDTIAGLPGCLFVACPDVVGDARATADQFNLWAESLRARALPIALVAQDGIEELGVPWDKIAALFIGGSTEFKLGPVAAGLAAEGKARDKWIHMGRVNSYRRMRYARSIGCDSVDGSKYSRFPDAHIPGALRMLDQAVIAHG